MSDEVRENFSDRLRRGLKGVIGGSEPLDPVLGAQVIEGGKMSDIGPNKLQILRAEVKKRDEIARAALKEKDRAEIAWKKEQSKQQDRNDFSTLVPSGPLQMNEFIVSTGRGGGAPKLTDEIRAWLKLNRPEALPAEVPVPLNLKQVLDQAHYAYVEACHALSVAKDNLKAFERKLGDFAEMLRCVESL